MKKIVDSTGAALGWLGPSLITFGLLTDPLAGHHRQDWGYCLKEPGEKEEAERWDALMLAVPASEDIAHEELLLAPQRLGSGEHADKGSLGGMPPVGSSSGQHPLAFAEELATLKAELTQIKEARATEQRELRDVRERLQELERKFDDLLAMQDFDAEEAAGDPHTQWIERNFDELRKYPDMFVALDPERGILIHSTDQNELAAMLEALAPEEHERVMLFHTSMYLRG